MISVLADKLGFRTTGVKFLPCSRRKPNSNKAAQKCVYDANVESDDTGKSTDVNDLSFTDTSDMSERSSGGTDVSDKETSTLDARPWRKSQDRLDKLPRGFCAGPPPGLEPLQGFQHKEMPMSTSLGHRMNAQARVFVPSSVAPAHAPEAQENSHQALIALQESLNKLTPSDAALVRAYLKDKESQQPVPGQLYRNELVAQTSGHRFGARPTFNNPSSTRQMFRPFTPFRGGPTKASLGNGADGSRVGTAPRKEKMTSSEGSETLRGQLLELSKLDSAKVLMVRKISPLGLDSGPALEAYFSKFGTIEKVMVSATRTAAKGSMRLRPASVGFLVFSKAEDVQAVLDFEEAHVVHGTAEGVTVATFPFESHPVDSL